MWKSEWWQSPSRGGGKLDDNGHLHRGFELDPTVLDIIIGGGGQ